MTEIFKEGRMVKLFTQTSHAKQPSFFDVLFFKYTVMKCFI